MSEEEKYLNTLLRDKFGHSDIHLGVGKATIARWMKEYADQQNEDLKDDYERGYIKGYSDCSFKKDPKF